MAVFRHLLLIILIVGGGVGASQLPNFARAYEQRVGGALDETIRLIAGFAAQAKAQGLDYQGLAERHRQSTDAAVRGTADRMAALTRRYVELDAEAKSLAAAPDAAAKLLLIGERRDADMITATLNDFQVTATLDPIFGAGGVVLGWLIYGLGALAVRPRRRTVFH